MENINQCFVLDVLIFRRQYSMSLTFCVNIKTQVGLIRQGFNLLLIYFHTKYNCNCYISNKIFVKHRI